MLTDIGLSSASCPRDIVQAMKGKSSALSSAKKSLKEELAQQELASQRK
jgi:hypothetical protein